MVKYTIWDLEPYVDIDTDLPRNTINMRSDNFEIVLDIPHDIYGAESVISFLFYQSIKNQNNSGEILATELTEIIENGDLPEEVVEAISEFIMDYIAEEQMMAYEVDYGYRNPDGSIPDEELFQNWRSSDMYRDMLEKFKNE